VGYRGKLEQREKARLLRAENRTLKEIAEILGVSKSSVSVWVRDMNVEIRQRRPGVRRSNALHDRKVAEIEECDQLGIDRIGRMSDGAFLAAGAALYAGEGAKRDGAVQFANTDSRMVAFFCAWLRRFFAVDEARLRIRVYLHDGLDLDAAEEFWSGVTGVPRTQFQAPHRAKADPTMRSNKHEHGCVYVRFSDARTHREIMGVVRALLASEAIPG
jgi:transcriptional regulator with XRE-family HTH domain